MATNDTLKSKFKKNVYLKPDEYLNGWARKCGWKASLVYDSLWRHADKDGRSFPSIRLMSEEHGVSTKTIERGLKTLIDFNLVQREQEQSKKTGKFLFNKYTLTDKNDWKEPVRLESPTVHRTPPQSFTVPPDVRQKGTHNKGTHNINLKVNSDKSQNPMIDYVLLEFKNLLGYQPTDSKPRYEAYNLIRRMQTFLKSRGKQQDGESTQKAIAYYFKWLSGQDWVDNVQHLGTLRRKTPIFFAEIENGKQIQA